MSSGDDRAIEVGLAAAVCADRGLCPSADEPASALPVFGSDSLEIDPWSCCDVFWESMMRRRGSTRSAHVFALLAALLVGMIALAGAGGAGAGDNVLIGTWRLKAFVREDFATGARRPALGEHPDGYVGYAPDGRMYALLVADGRVVPAGDPPTDAERAQLQR
jgi:Lipocalin-like domain